MQFFKAATDRVWTRDSGPTFVVNDRQRAQFAEQSPDPIGLIDWRFNAWAKYDNHRNDSRIPRRIARAAGPARAGVPRVELEGKPDRVVLEGGAIDVNGRGTLLTTEECLLSDVQAATRVSTARSSSKCFADYLGVRNVIWLGQGIAGDDTHGHVDDLARFVDPRTVVTVVEPRADDPNHEPLADNLRAPASRHATRTASRFAS